jgi:hypothetical protein
MVEVLPEDLTGAPSNPIATLKEYHVALLFAEGVEGCATSWPIADHGYFSQ